MTLKEHQEQNPGYDVWQGGGDCDWFDRIESYVLKEWRPIQFSKYGNLGVFIDSNEIDDEPEFVRLKILIDCGAIFRRKKERKREFVIDVRYNGGRVMNYKIDGDSDCFFSGFAQSKRIKRATLWVDEWEDES